MRVGSAEFVTDCYRVVTGRLGNGFAEDFSRSVNGFQRVVYGFLKYVNGLQIFVNCFLYLCRIGLLKTLLKHIKNGKESTINS